MSSDTEPAPTGALIAGVLLRRLKNKVDGPGFPERDGALTKAREVLSSYVGNNQTHLTR